MWLYPTTMALYVTTVTFYVIINITVLIELSKWDRICPSVTLYLTTSLNLTTVTLYLMMWLSHNYDFIYSLPEYCWPCPSLHDYSVPIFWCYFQQDNAPCHKAQIISDWFLEHDNEFTLLKCPPQSPDLNPIEHLWDVVEREIHIMDVQPTNLQQLRDAIMSIWTKIYSTPCWI